MCLREAAGDDFGNDCSLARLKQRELESEHSLQKTSFYQTLAAPKRHKPKARIGLSLFFALNKAGGLNQNTGREAVRRQKAIEQKNRKKTKS